jgi:hypothetical protein
MSEMPAMSMMADDEELVVTAHVHDAKCLPDTQIFGIQNPYVYGVVLPSRTSHARTQYDRNGDTHPIWEAVLHLSPGEFDEEIMLQVWNANYVVDTAIGDVRVPIKDIGKEPKRLGLQLNQGGIVEVSLSLELRKKAKDADALGNKLVTVPNQLSTRVLKIYREAGTVFKEEALANRVLQMTILDAKDLKNLLWFGSMSPYVVAKILPLKQTKYQASQTTHYACVRTKAVSGGGCDPAWEVDKHKSVVFLVPGEPGENRIVLEVMNANIFLIDDSVGRQKLDLDYDALAKGAVETTIDLEPEGKLRLSFTWQDMAVRGGQEGEAADASAVPAGGEEGEPEGEGETRGPNAESTIGGGDTAIEWKTAPVEGPAGPLVKCSFKGCIKKTTDLSGYCKPHRGTEDGKAAVAAAAAKVAAAPPEAPVLDATTVNKMSLPTGGRQ